MRNVSRATVVWMPILAAVFIAAGAQAGSPEPATPGHGAAAPAAGRLVLAPLAAK